MAGMAAGSSDVPVDHLDYGHIGKLSNTSELEKILKVLRSRSEGYYPDLIKFTEDRLRTLKPSSKLLIEDQKVKRAKELSKEQLNEIRSDMKQWEEDMTEKDRHLSSSSATHDDDESHILPPVRTTVNINPQSKAKSTKKEPNPSRIKSSDYSSWDKFEPDKVEEKVVEDKTTSTGSSCKVPPEKLSAKELSLSEHEKERQADKEREKGNEAFRAGDYKEALVYYSRSISFCPSPPAYNNKALTLNKLGRYSESVGSCNEVLKVEPNNIKALLRRADAYCSLKQYEQSVSDIESVLKIEPANKRATELLKKVNGEMGRAKGVTDENGGGAKGGAKKGKRITIEEVDGTNEESKGEEPVAKTTKEEVVEIESKPRPPVVQAPLPPAVQKKKEEGNSFFKRGQYGDAVGCYTKCIQLLEKESGDHSQSLSIVLSNRAACHFKNGDCRGCINDATRSIELVPVNLKSFVRRAQAYETMEKYKEAYCDYQLALRIDSRVDQARLASSRISLLLRDAHGNNWRDFLPANSDIDRVKAGLAEMSPQATPPTPQATPPKPEEKGGAPLPPNTPVVMSTVSSGSDTSPSQSTSAPVQSSSTGSNTTATNASSAMDRKKDFEDSKSKGNEFVKQTNYQAAVECYTHCVSLQPHEVAPYTNRALCHLKLSQFSLAEDDCSKALALDNTNPKALYRRALARKGLGKLNEALKDLRTLIGQEPDNGAAKKEEKLVYDLYLQELRKLQETPSSSSDTGGLSGQSSKKSSGKKSKPAATPSATPPAAKQPTSKSKRKKVTIDEVVEPEVTEDKGDEREVGEIKEKLSDIKQVKLSLMEYRQLWNTTATSSATTPRQYAELLIRIPSDILPQVIGSKLEGFNLTGIVSAVEQYIMKECLYKVAYDVLLSLTTVPRFKMILMFLSETDKQCLRRIFSSLEGTGSYNYEQINKLRHSYSLL
ncbi:PREDICTED: sperm-associated antigen 1-like [Amphimedon queenslandica]|uniref:RNA-polymerase II-associated protein 3-like C-terminal domain-containing protein n=1 Tax=Amphimedon queenslandica TaxID=400682 RepID=A0A1X7VDA7_AMPQE|nr:PREDICTED: sperm-associated antigen 1-like [Amphimedon queenslandica]|eukprot:XP_011402495.1 PREDICTED: sperm-associated antigen 1-like [Amphimedon queenslandica]